MTSTVLQGRLTSSSPAAWYGEDLRQRGRGRGEGAGVPIPTRELKGVYHDDDSDSVNGDCRKKLYVMYGGSWELVSRRDVKTIRREVLSVKPGSQRRRRTKGG